jgi:acetoacetyl-CoA reductase
MSQRVALVTGGNGGLGTAICKALVDQGRKVVAGYYPPEKEAAEAWQKQMAADGYEVEIAGGDVSDYEDTVRMIREIEERVGPITILINNAGITRDKMLKRMTPDMWNAVIDTNLNSVFNVTQPVVEGMLEAGFGRIVNISSVNGQKGQLGQANYSAAKAGMHGFTKAVAQETIYKGITVNTISPGYIATEMVMAVPEEIREKIISQIPVQRLGKPEEIAATVAFLCSADAAFITGANMPVNGGQFMG